MTLEEQAREAFHAINSAEYQCALAEAQVSETLFNQVKKEYAIAEQAFIQGVMYHQNLQNEQCGQ